jgi:hypothetical protein
MPDSGINLSTTFGALAVGSVLCTVFWSFLLVQTYATSPWFMMRHSPPHAECTTMPSPCHFLTPCLCRSRLLTTKTSFSHDTWPSRVVAYTMLIIGTAFEILYLHGRECSPKLKDLPLLTGAAVVWDTLIIHFGSPTAAIATNPYVKPLLRSPKC